jgi:hypothetical protein
MGIMNKSLLTLVLAGALGFSSLAMASDLSSSDSEFLFSRNQVATTTISAGEMKTTEGRSISVSVSAPGVDRTVIPPASSNAQADVDLSVPLN